jgi:hypothetical protein
VLEETQETEEIIQRVAALDVGKAELTCCVHSALGWRTPVEYEKLHATDVA